MINSLQGKVSWVNANKKTQRIGVQLGTKVIPFYTSLDEHFDVGDEMIVTAKRALVVEPMQPLLFTGDSIGE